MFLKPNALSALALLATSTIAHAQSSRYEALANQPLAGGFLSKGAGAALMDELTFQRATQAYLWALPALNMYGMKEGSEKVFGKGYNILPVFKDRLNAKTLITTPNSDVIYALGYLDLKEDGPMVIEVPPGLQGILDDFWQRQDGHPALEAAKRPDQCPHRAKQQGKDGLSHPLMPGWLLE